MKTSDSRSLSTYRLFQKNHSNYTGKPLDKWVSFRDGRDTLWRGEHCLAIWKLWGLRSTAKNWKRIDDLIGYLLRKKHQLANYEERHARGEWIASTRVEKLFGRSTGDGTTLRHHNDANIAA